MKIDFNKIRQELRFHVPTLFLIGCLSTTVAAKTIITQVALNTSTPSNQTTVKIDRKRNAELRSALTTAYVPPGALEALESIKAADDVTEPSKIESQVSKMVLGGSRSWFNGVQGEDEFTDDDSLAAKLKVLWMYKMQVPGVKPAAQKSMNVILDRFQNSPKTKMNIKVFVKRADRLVRDSRKHLNYKAFCSRMKMSDQECDLLYDITDDLKGRDMVAYGMTELMPSMDGDKNITILNNVLQTAGIEFINSVPAFGDPLMSCGMYQFTSFAVRKDETHIEGASIVNEFMAPGSKIPGSVVMLSSDDQHRAAFLFTTFNVARWIKRMNQPQMKMLKHLMPKHQSELIEYIAVSHHMPARTITYANTWLDHKGKDDFLSFLPPHLKMYGTKTRKNYQALKAYLG